MYRLWLPLCLLWSADALAGEPLLVPDFNGATFSDLAVTYMLQDRVVEGLAAAGFVVLSSAVADHALEPGIVDDCVSRDECPTDALRRLPARVGLVASAGRVEGGIEVRVQLFEQGDPSPVEERTMLVAPGDEDSFARELALMVQDLFDLLGPGRADDILAAVRLIDDLERSRQPEPEPEPEPVVDLDDLDDLDEVEDSSGSGDETERTTGERQSTLELLDGTGIRLRHVRGVEDRLHDSRMDPRDWYAHSSPHGGRFILELHGGAGIGDVDRAADIRVDIDDSQVTLSSWYQEGPTVQTRPRGGASLGYAPNAWVDIIASGGIQYGEKTLTTGFTRDGEDPRSGEADPAGAIQGFVQLAVRVYVVPAGPAKPYLKVGGEVRIFDGFFIEESTVDYPSIPGGWTAGAMGGGGILFDLVPAFGLFADGAYTRHFGVRAEVLSSGDTPMGAPAAPEGSRGTIAITGGIQIRL